MEQCIVAIRISIPGSSFFLWLEDVVVSLATWLSSYNIVNTKLQGLSPHVLEVEGTGGRAETSLNTCFGSKNLGSIFCGARYPWHTTKISADTLLRASLAPISTHTRVNIPRRGRFSRLYLAKELIKDPDEVIIVDGAEYFGHKCAAGRKKLDSKLQTHKHELALAIRILDPSCSNIWSTVMKYDICSPVLEFIA